VSSPNEDFVIFNSEDEFQSALGSKAEIQPEAVELIGEEPLPVPRPGAEMVPGDPAAASAPPPPVTDEAEDMPRAGILAEGLRSLADRAAVDSMSAPAVQREPSANVNSPQANLLPAQLPEGMTPIHPDDFPITTQMLAQSFLSMNETGMILSTSDRVAYAMAVMNNRSLRSDVKAQHIDQVMRDGKIVPQALSPDWYEARNFSLRPFNPEAG
jgi:hypothetical protein